MGSFITNLHVRDAAPRAVIDVLRSLGVMPAYVRGSPAESWTGVFPEAAFQDEAGLSDLCCALSNALQRPAIGFIVHDSDILLYILVDGGKQLDRYNSAPGYFTGDNQPPEGGDPEILIGYCRPGTSAEVLSRLLHPERHPQDPAQAVPDARDEVLEAVRKKVIQSYPAMAAKMPNPPSLEQYLADIEKRMAGHRSASAISPTTIARYVPVEERLEDVAKLLGISDGQALDSFYYIANGEGTPGSLTLLAADSESTINLT